MSLLPLAETFLRQPSTDALAASASLSYVPTLTTINEPAAILRHFQAQSKQLKKNAEKVLDVIEGSNGVHLETETILEFVTGGGAYLPGLDDNFLADKIVTLPLTYVVHFDGEQKITNIRIYWDQGSMLKQLEVIGARGRNWPIRDGKEQSKLIASQSSVPVKEAVAIGVSTRRSTTSSSGRSQAASVSATGDPHASLNLFAPRQHEEDEHSYLPQGESVAPRTTARPPVRDAEDILTGNYDPASPRSPTSGAGSPTKRSDADRNHARIGASKHFQPMRLFDEEEEATPRISPSKSSKKYNHFEFGHGEDAPPISSDKLKEDLAKSKKDKHRSQWDLQDFVTPDVREIKVARQNQRTYDWNNEAEEESQRSPTFRPVVHHARPDAQVHFSLTEDTPTAGRKQPEQQPIAGLTGVKGRQHNAGLQLYKDHILGTTDSEDESVDVGTADTGPAKQPLKTATNIQNARRSKDFTAQWEAADKSPAVQRGEGEAGKENGNGYRKPVLTNEGKKVLMGMDASWTLYESSPDAAAAKAAAAERQRQAGGFGEGKENVGRGIKTAGNGMGGRNTVRNWGFGGDEAEDEEAGVERKKKEGAKVEPKSFWDF